MKALLAAVVVALVSASGFTGQAFAADSCQSKAVGKDGKPLAGAALKSFMTKCTQQTCEASAVGKDGKPLAGAAKASFMKKCQSQAAN